MVSRGCGTRQAGGVYLSSPLSPNGMPISWFLLDPPVVVDKTMEESLGISEIGVKLIKRPNAEVWDVWDIVGQNNYPNVADMVMEIAKLGLSRRIAVGEAFELLSSESRIILLHRRAHIENFHDYYGTIFMESDEMARDDRPEMDKELSCPRRILEALGLRTGPHHEADPGGNSHEMCAGLWWEDVTNGERLYDPDLRKRSVRRVLGDTTYIAREKPEEVEPEYELAIFAKMPIRQIEVIRDLIGHKHVGAVSQAARSSLPVSVEDE